MRLFSEDEKVLQKPFVKESISKQLVVNQKEENLPLYRDIIEKPNKSQKMIKRQIKDFSTQKGNCV